MNSARFFMLNFVQRANGLVTAIGSSFVWDEEQTDATLGVSVDLKFKHFSIQMESCEEDMAVTVLIWTIVCH